MRTSNQIKVGARGSPLALAQVEEIKTLLTREGIHRDFDVTIFGTKGDKDRRTPLTADLPDDFFTDALDQALLKDKIDIAIHSAKDLPQLLPDGLEILALTKGLDDTDALVGKATVKKLPPGSRIGTSSLLRQQSLKALNPKLKPCDIRGNIEARLKQLDAGKFDAIIVATCALKRLQLSHRIKQIMPWESTPLQGQLAVLGRADSLRWRGIFSRIDVRRQYGDVYLVGAGPGAADLITLRGIKLLQQADIVFYDFLINKELLRFAPQARKIYVGKRKGAHTLPQQELNKKIKEAALAGKTVVRLKGGDPLIFGRGADEISYLRSYHINVEIIPGVSSATGIPASLSIPLTARGISDSVAFVSAHSEGESSGKKAKLLIPACKTIVFLMGLTKLKEVVRSLKQKRWSKTTPVAIISKGTYPDERIVTGDLSNIIKRASVGGARERPLQQPALIIAGETVRFYRPCRKRKTILYTGTNPQKYEANGRLIHLPMIKIVPQALPAKSRRAFVSNFEQSDVILLTSRFAVLSLFDILKKEKMDGPFIRQKSYVAIGRATAEALSGCGISADLVSLVESSEGLFKAMKRKYALKGLKILFPRSSLPNPFLKEALRQAGAVVKEFNVYQNKKPAKRPLPRAAIDEIYFTSPSTVKNFLDDYGAIPSTWAIRSRGELTRRSLKKAGYASSQIR